MTVRQLFFALSAGAIVIILVLGFFWHSFYGGLFLVLPIIALGVYDLIQSKHTILRLYPVIGHFRYMLEGIRPEIQQYFIETDTNGAPVSRDFRSVIYQRAKGQRDTRPFGTLNDVYRDGYEWIDHSLAPKTSYDHNPRVRFGGPDCTQPYDASPLNISAMSYGSLSKNAIMALNLGAKTGGFAHNTGEGGVSPYHQKYDGDLVWQIGTGYFGCRDQDGGFDADLFKKYACLDSVKMVEIKLSQGAKPGHGGILPAVKLSEEIAAIRHVPMGADVISPPAHTAFSSPAGLLHFVAKLRDLSDGKPVGFKLCIGRKSDFLAICKAMVETGITPDFITVDGSEGGTGAAPLELTNSVGTPLRDALVFVDQALKGVELRDRIRIIASGKALSAFHVLRLLALGADSVNAARAMMFALGCIQSLHCNRDTCPTGIATQDPVRTQALDVDHKGKRVARYHAAMVENLMELLAAAGLERLDQLTPSHINHRVNGTEVRSYAQLFPSHPHGFLRAGKDLPNGWQQDWDAASPDHW